MPLRALALLLALTFTACGDETPAGPPTDQPPVDEPSAEAPPEEQPAPAPTRVDEMAGHARVGAVLSEDARAILAAPERVTLHSIEPDPWSDYGYGRNTEPSPLAHALETLKAKTGVLGSLPLEGAEERGRVLEGLYAGLIEEGPEAACYLPRHALIYEKGEATVAVLICFQCHYLVVLEAETAKGRYKAFQDPDGLKQRLNTMLADAGIALAK